MLVPVIGLFVMGALMLVALGTGGCGARACQATNLLSDVGGRCREPLWVKRYVLCSVTARQSWFVAVFGTPSHGL
jgi:hypothetical protein